MEFWQLQQLQGLPLEAKIEKSKLRIREWYEHWEGQVYVAFSGGKDSTVLLDLVRSLYPEVPAVFFDTGLEFPEIREFIKSVNNVEWVKSKMSFRQVIEKYGYPVPTKEISRTIYYARKGSEWALKKLFGENNFNDMRKWIFLYDSNIPVSDECCNIMKKTPSKAYAKATKRKAYVGAMANESKLRLSSWLRNGCNSFDGKNKVSNPLSFWNEQDIWGYIKAKNLQYSKIYDMGYHRTGCMFCMFGCHLEKGENRFQRMQRTHPQLWNYCMKDTSMGGLGLSKVLDFIKVPYKDYVPELRDYEQMKLPVA